MCLQPQLLLELRILHELSSPTALQQDKISIKSGDSDICETLRARDHDLMNVQVRDGGGGRAEWVRFGCFAFLACVVLPCLLSTLHLTPNYSNQLLSHSTLHLHHIKAQYIYMRTNIHSHANLTAKFETKSNVFSPKKRHYDLECRVIQKNVSSVLSINKSKHEIKPKNILFTSQHAPLKKDIYYEFLPTFSSNLSTPSKRLPSARERTIAQVMANLSGLKSRCQSAFSRTQSLKNASQQRQPSKVLNSVGVLMQEKGRKGQQVYTLNLLRIHGFSQKKIRINNFMF